MKTGRNSIFRLPGLFFVWLQASLRLKAPFFTAKDRQWTLFLSLSLVYSFNSMVNVPKERKTFCKGKKCGKHTLHKVTQYKAGKASNFAQVSDTVHIFTQMFFPKFFAIGKAKIRCQANGFRWTDKANLPQKGKIY